MSLTGKLILGFLFALVLQISQMVISGYFTAQLQETTEQVSAALAANLAVQNGIDATRQLEGRIREDLDDEAAQIDLDVYSVYLDEADEQARQFRETLANTASGALQAVDQQLELATRSIASLRTSSPTALKDEVHFFEDSVRDLQQALNKAQVDLKALAISGVDRVHEVHGLPVRAGLIVTLAGVLLMAAFVAWFSRQLVIPIERAWAELELRVADRTAELATSVANLEEQIEQRQRVEAQKEELNRRLIDTSRRAGMAELANGVLHNVGNVLNSVNTSSALLMDGLRQSKVHGLHRALALLHEHEHDLASFMTDSKQGQLLPKYLGQLADHLVKEHHLWVAESEDLTTRVGHMMEIVSRQQSYARAAVATCIVRLSSILDEVLSMHTASFSDCEMTVVKQFEFDDAFPMDRSRVMQIFMNLIGNAKHAIRAHRSEGGILVLKLTRSNDERVCAAVCDNGIGISSEGLTKIFTHGFTTKSDGHGFGLHHSANAASEMGGRLWAESAGIGLGATFLLELPLSQSSSVSATETRSLSTASGATS